MAGSALAVLVVAAASVIAAAAYLVYRDDLLGAAISRQIEMQHAYEDRIAALRSELDRVTSRHFVQTESVEQQLAVLLSRQALIERRQSTLDDLVTQAQASGVRIAAAEARLPRARPGADMTEEGPPVDPLGYMPLRPAAGAAITDTLLQAGAPGDQHTGIRAKLSGVHASLDAAQGIQSQALDALGVTVADEAQRLSEALAPVGIRVQGAEPAEPQGGPYLPAAGAHFIERATILERLLEEVRSLRQSGAAMPLRAPLAEPRISSGFGNRLDPFLKRQAFHAGLDLAAPEGTEVRSTAPGVVVSAGRSDGYGNMVEIRHEGGVSTRYGHLSAVLVERGVRVAAGTTIGRVGSTGRSTGPHLHYETRRDGAAVDPAAFIAAGRALRGP